MPLSAPTIIVANDEAVPHREPPHNIAVEQALLGAILVNNEALAHLNEQLTPEAFHEPVHQHIFAAIKRHYDKGLIANPTTLKHFFDQHEQLADIGGAEYLARLAAGAITIIDVADYSQLLVDLAQKRALIGIGTEVVNTAYVASDERSAAEQIEQAEQQLFNLAANGAATRSAVSLSTSLVSAIASAELAYKRTGETIGLPTRLKALDKLLGGLQNSDLVILAGRPSMGKTALATNIAHEIAKHFLHLAESQGEEMQSVGFFSLEMSAEQLAGRLLASESGLNSSAIRKGDLTDKEFGTLVAASQVLARLPLYIDDTPALTISALRTRARRLKRVHKMGLMVVDYLQLCRGSATSGDNRVQEVSEVTMGLKAIAKELNIPVLALSQLSRQVESREDKRPQLSDLRESGSIEQDSDVVMFVFREEYYVMRTMPREDDLEKYQKWQERMEQVHGLAEIMVAKHRHGPVGNLTVAFASDQARFHDLEPTPYG